VSCAARAKTPVTPRQRYQSRPPDPAKETESGDAFLTFEAGQVVEANPIVDPDQGKTRKPTYLKMKVKPNPRSETTSICFDTGASSNLVD